jgi:hypothetical protein
VIRISLRLPTTPADIHPPLRFPLYSLHLQINQLHQRRTRRILPEHFVPNLQQQLINIQLDRACAYTPLHDLRREVIRAMQCHQNALVDLLVDCLKAVEVDLPFCRARGPVVAVHVADRRREDVDARGDEFVDVIRGRKQRYYSIS